MEADDVPEPSYPPATWVAAVDSGMLLKPEQLTVPLFVTVPEVQVTVMADGGIWVQLLPVPAVKLAVLAATFRVHVLLVAPPEIVQVTWAWTLPATALPGLLAANEMVVGVATTELTVAAHASCAGIRKTTMAAKYRFIPAAGLSQRAK